MPQSNESKRKKTCVVIGTTRLCVSILKILNKFEWDILLVVSNDHLVRDYCHQKNIPIFESLNKVSHQNFTLFSVANYQIISEKFLKRCQVETAINYHDSLLPKYAGLNSPTWSIYNKESFHGVSWHQIVSKLDEGRLFEQASRPMDQADTAFSLNVKNFELAIESFTSLLQNFEKGNQNSIEQDLSEKTYFGRDYLPENYGLITFDSSYEETERLYRSLYFGKHDYINTVASFKVFDGENFFLPESIAFTQHNDPKPGYVYAVDSKELQIGIKDGVLSLKNLSTLEGRSCLITDTKFAQGHTLPSRLFTDAAKQVLKNAKKGEFAIRKTLSVERSSFFANTFIKGCLEKIKFTIPLDENKNDESLSRVLITLSKFIREKILVPVQNATFMQDTLLDSLIVKERLFVLTPKIQNYTIETFNKYVTENKEHLIFRDFAYRYHLDRSLDEVLIVIGKPSLNSKRLKITITEKDLIIEGYKQDNTLIKSFYSSLSLLMKRESLHNQTLIKDLSILNPKERKLILADWNDTGSEYPFDQTLVTLFEQQAAKIPHQTAVVFNEASMTFMELNCAANRLAKHMQCEYEKIYNEPFQTGTLVPICAERSIQFIIGILAIMKAGGAYVPIEPDSAKERIDYILRDVNCKVLLMQSSLVPNLAPPCKIDIEQNLLDRFSGVNLNQDVQATNLAYIIYTSGTTGQPKGVMIEHQAAINTLWGLKRVYDFSSIHRKSGCYCSFVFDVSVIEIFTSLLFEGELHLFDSRIKFSPQAISDYILENELNYLYLPPAVLGLLPKKNYPSLRAIIFAGEPCDQKVGAYWAANMNLFNYYGPTECAVYATGKKAHKRNVNEIGRPLPNKKAYILDRFQNPVPIGVVGELHLGGEGLAKGYLNLPELTQEKFIPNPLQTNEERKYGKNTTLYKTGDLVKWLPDGNLEYIGRDDFQVKVRGFRVETAEIEKAISSFQGVKQSTVLVQKNLQQSSVEDKIILGFYVSKKPLNHTALLDFLRAKLPNYMIPSLFVHLQQLPLNASGKLDKNFLIKISKEQRQKTTGKAVESLPTSDIEKSIFEIWCDVLGRKDLALTDVFFQMGGNSLLAMLLISKVNKLFGLKLSILDLFQHPTISTFSKYLQTRKDQKESTTKPFFTPSEKCDEFAIIGMACRVPGANSLRQFWNNLQEGIETIQDLPCKEKDPRYVSRAGNVDGYSSFDANFFGYTPREAQSMDPQHRHFMEVVHEALEDSGCVFSNDEGQRIGLYAGQGENIYYQTQVFGNKSLEQDLGRYQIRINNDKDFLTTKISYKLNLTGPSLSVQTACSSSLVAVHVAVEQLLQGECEIAIAGGVSIEPRRGYYHKPGMIESSDGHCRAFDTKADGTVITSGVGAIVIKPLRKAIQDGNHCYAIIKATAINNDGGGTSKVGYTAPSINGQAKVIQQALDKSRIDPSTISFIEAHGTGTKVGDPIELLALHKIYSAFPLKNNSIAIGSVKTNIGHTDAAAGIVGLIKAALALKHKKLPPTLHFKEWNREIEAFNTLFYVNKDLTSWKTDRKSPRRAGVSSFGIGGTNAHVILEEPYTLASEPSNRNEICLFSAKTESSLEKYTDQFESFLKTEKSLSIGDVAFTLRNGRKELLYRSFFVTKDKKFLSKELHKSQIQKVPRKTDIIFMFPGQGSQYLNMARDLYQQLPDFASIVDHGNQILKQHLNFDLTQIVFGDANDKSRDEQLKQTQYAQPALYLFEYALCSLLVKMGLKPKALIGHSIGEYTAATLSGVFSFEDALLLVGHRGRLMQTAPKGAMLSVQLSKDQTISLLPSSLDLSLVNAPNQSVVSGTFEAIDSFTELLNQKEIKSTLLHTSHGFHSRMMQPILNDYLHILRRIKKNKAEIPILSNLTGNWSSDNEMQSDTYWLEHLSKPVLFYEELQTALKSFDSPTFIEVGPGQTLVTLVKLANEKTKAFQTLPHQRSCVSSYETLLQALGECWKNGEKIQWDVLYPKKNFVSIPTYSFDHKNYSLQTALEESRSETAAPLEKNNPGCHTSMEKIWSDLLGVSKISPRDNFFELGGHSLLAVQLIRHIESTLKVSLKMRDIFEHPTFETLDQFVRDSFKESKSTTLPVIQTNETNKNLSAQQKSLWTIQKFFGEHFNAYNEAILFKSKTASRDFSISNLKRALLELLKRHQILKSNFFEDENGDLYCQYCSGRIDIEKGKDILSEIKRPFNIEKDPLFRVRIFDKEREGCQILIVFHHLVIDGASIKIFCNELSEIYNALLKEEVPKLKPISKTYQDYVQYQKSFFKSDKYAQKLAYWKETLKNCQQLETPQCRSRKNKFSFRGDRCFFTFDTKLAGDLNSISRLANTTLFNVFLAGFSVLLSRFCRQNDILIGAPMLNRTDKNFHNLIGLFTNIVALRNQISGDHSFLQLLKHVHNNTLQAYENQDIPFDHVVANLNLERDLSRNPLVQALLLVVNKSSHPALLLGEQHFSLVEIPVAFSSKFDLSLNVFEHPNEIRGFFEFSLDIFDKETVKQLATDLRSFFIGVTSNPDKPLCDLPNFNQKDQLLVTTKWNPIYQKRNEFGCLHERFSINAQSNADQIALKFGQESLTYLELDQYSNQLASYLLKEKGPFGKDALIAICLEPSFDTIISILGVMKAGAAYLPIDTQYPDSRIQYILTDSKAQLILLNTKNKDRLKAICPNSSELLVLNESKKKINAQPISTPLIPHSENDLAYVIYTSGSTGNPKGTLIPHSNVLDLFYAAQKYYKFNQKDVWVLFHSFAFDVSVWEIWGALLNCGTLVIVPFETTRDPYTFYNITIKEHVTVLNQTPSAFRNYIDADLNAFNKIQSLRYVIFAGEPLDIEILRNWWSTHKERQPLLVNMYGTTETTIHATFQPLSLSDLKASRNGRVGFPLNHLTIYIFDEMKKLCSIGVPGEIYIAGKGLARGFLNRKKLTEEKFILNPYNPKERLYRTGDLGKWAPDGSLEYIGRIDFQVKIRGFRIELGEIESLLMKYPGIKQVIVLVKEEGQQKELICYYTAEFKPSLANSEKLKEHLEEFLPQYMIPKAFVYLKKIPLTVNGKVDRKLLPNPDFSLMGGEYFPPTTVLEKKLVSIWSELLNIPKSKISIRANYFLLGGNSISIIKMISLVKAHTGKELPIATFWKSPCIQMISKAIEGSKTHDAFLYSNYKKRISGDLFLPEPVKASGYSREKLRHIFITGATGFLGVNLINELSKNCDLELYCLVRASGHNEALKKLNSSFTRNGLSHLKSSPNIHVVCGDLSLDLFGLSQIEYDTLALKIDIIYHNGALVHHLYDYEKMRSVNVFSTKSILQFAATRKKNKYIHYISTIDVLRMNLNECLNNDKANWSFFELNGYLLTKWVSEQLVLKAAARGLRAYIYRPGNITGNCMTGYCDPTTNYTLLKMKGFIQLGKAYYGQNELFEMVPVDLLAQIIVQKSLNPGEKQIYNLDNPNKIPFGSYLEQFIRNKYKIDRVDTLEEWYEILSEIDEQNALYPFKNFYKSHSELNPLDTKSDLPRSINNYGEWIKKQISFLEQTGFIIKQQEYNYF